MVIQFGETISKDKRAAKLDLRSCATRCYLVYSPSFNLSRVFFHKKHDKATLAEPQPYLSSEPFPKFHQRERLLKQEVFHV